MSLAADHQWSILYGYLVDHDDRKFEQPTVCTSTHHGGHHLLAQHLPHGCHKQTAESRNKVRKGQMSVYLRTMAVSGQPHRSQERQACAGRHHALTLVLDGISVRACGDRLKRPEAGGFTAQMSRRAWKWTPSVVQSHRPVQPLLRARLERQHIRSVTYVRQAGRQRSCGRPFWSGLSLHRR